MGTSTVLRIDLPEPADTELLGERIARITNGNALVTLFGDLGAGKTTFARGAARALSVTDIVNSPTFTMLNEYHSGTAPVYHLDLYRMGENLDVEPTQVDFLTAELDELSGRRGFIMVEWPQFLDDYFSVVDHLRVELYYQQPPPDKKTEDLSSATTGRSAVIRASGKLSQAVVDSLRNIYFS